MQQDQLLIDDEIFKLCNVAGRIRSDKLPKLYEDATSAYGGSYYYLGTLSERCPVNNHDVYVFRSEYYMATSGHWVKLEFVSQLEDINS